MTNSTLNSYLETVKHVLAVVLLACLVTITIYVMTYRRSIENELYLSSGAVQSMANDYGQVARATTPALNDLDKMVQKSGEAVDSSTLAITQASNDVHQLIQTVQPQVNGILADSRSLLVTMDKQIDANGSETQATIKRLGVAVDNVSNLLTGEQMQSILAEIGKSAKNIRIITENIPPEDVKAFMDSLTASGANVQNTTLQLAGITTNMNAISTDLATQVHTTLNPPKPQGFMGHLKYYALQASWVLKDGYLLLKLFGAAP